MVGTPASSASSTAAEHGLLVVLQNERQDLDHLAVAAGRLEQVLLQRPERVGQLGEGRAVAQGAGLALNDRQIVPPVVDRRALADHAIGR